MIKFLIICTIFLLFYLSVVALSYFDSSVIIFAYDYSVETTFFSLLAFIIISAFFVFILLKSIFAILQLPYLIKKGLYVIGVKKRTHSILYSMSQLIIGRKDKAIELAQKLSPNLSTEYRELYNLVLAESEQDFSQKIHYFRNLVDSKNYSQFATKRLAWLFYNEGFYEQAEEYAATAFNMNEFDSEILEILIRCYAKFALWPKFIFVVSKLARVDQKKLAKLANEIAEYYLLAAKNTLEDGDDNEANNYLELALELCSTNIEILELYCTLNLNKRSKNLKIIKTAFTSCPSFEIAELYIRHANSLPQEAYNELASVVDPSSHKVVFLAIAAYLDLPKEIMFFKAPKFLTHNE